MPSENAYILAHNMFVEMLRHEGQPTPQKWWADTQEHFACMPLDDVCVLLNSIQQAEQSVPSANRWRWEELCTHIYFFEHRAIVENNTKALKETNRLFAHVKRDPQEDLLSMDLCIIYDHCGVLAWLMARRPPAKYPQLLLRSWEVVEEKLRAQSALERGNIVANAATVKFLLKQCPPKDLVSALTIVLNHPDATYRHQLCACVKLILRLCSMPAETQRAVRSLKEQVSAAVQHDV